MYQPDVGNMKPILQSETYVLAAVFVVVGGGVAVVAVM